MEGMCINKILHKKVVEDSIVPDGINVLINCLQPQLIKAFVTNKGRSLFCKMLTVLQKER